jgi:hypothetical protein
VYITDSAPYSLLPPSDIETPLDMAQRISGAWGEREFILDAWVQADEARLSMNFMNSFGADVGELSYRAAGISLSSAYLPSSLKPEYIVADFQFCFYRAAPLSHALEDLGLALSVERRAASGGGWMEVRVLSEGGKPIAEIEKNKDVIRYTNYLRGYSYTISGDFP